MAETLGSSHPALGLSGSNPNGDGPSRSHALVYRHPEIVVLLETLGEPVALLGQDTRIVYANQALADLAGREDPDELTGLLPGEAVRCRNSLLPGGCGGNPACELCGVRDLFSHVRAGGRAGVETSLQLVSGRTCEFRLQMCSLQLGEESYVLASFRDLEDKRRRRLLEQVFFDDILAHADNLRGLVDLLIAPEVRRPTRLREELFRQADLLVESVCYQRDLAAAEAGELMLNACELLPGVFLREVVSRLSVAESAKQRIELRPGAPEASFWCDPRHLRAIVRAMLHNALEASQPGEIVRLACVFRDPERLRFSVCNRAVMAPEVQRRVFQRYFTTKRNGLGLGTYTMKLFGERFLEGEVGFFSTEEAGTCFWVEIPRRPSYA